MAACAPTLLPGFRWLNSFLKDCASFRSPSKSPRLMSVERRSPEDKVGHRSSKRLGNDVSIDTVCTDAMVSGSQIKKTSVFELEHRQVTDYLNVERLS